MSPSAGCQPVVLSHLPVDDRPPVPKEPGALEPDESRIELTRVQPIAVVRELFEHPEPVDLAFRGMMEDVELDEIDGESFSIHDIVFGYYDLAAVRVKGSSRERKRPGSPYS